MDEAASATKADYISAPEIIGRDNGTLDDRVQAFPIWGDQCDDAWGHDKKEGRTALVMWERKTGFEWRYPVASFIFHLVHPCAEFSSHRALFVRSHFVPFDPVRDQMVTKFLPR